jgi:dolichol-phosphate mannosyltransferase
MRTRGTVARTSGVWRAPSWALLAARAAAAGVAVVRISRARARRPPLAADPESPTGRSISIVVPARDEARRIGPLLDAIRDAPGVAEVLVVDDESSDETRAVAVAGGARVIAGRPLPDGWAGKAWALQQGLEAARAEWVVTLDADTRPDPVLPAALVARAIRDALGLVTVADRLRVPDARHTVAPPCTPDHPRLPLRPARHHPRAAAGAPARERSVHGVRAAGTARARWSRTVSGSVVEDVALARHLAGADGPSR